VDAPLRILQMHNRHGSRGGADEVLHQEQLLLTGAGHEVEQLTLPGADELGLSSMQAGARAVWNRDAARATTARVVSFRPDVVHVHTPFPLMSPAVFRAAKRAGVPTVVTLHSFRFSCVAATCHRDGHICEDCVGRRIKWPAVQHKCYHDSALASGALALSLLTHRALGTFHHDIDRYLTLTGFARDLMIRDGYPAEKILVKPNSVPDTAEVGDPDLAAPYIFFAGRLIDIKGVRTLLEAWRRVTMPGLRLVIAGDGALRDLVEGAAEADDRIDWRGWVDEGTVTRLMSRAIATIVPSEWYEAGPPLTLIRSLSVGTPVLASDLENVSSELLEDRAGWCFSKGDSPDLAKAIEGVATDPETTTGIRQRARSSFEARYSPPVNLQRLETVYQSLLQGGPSTPLASRVQQQ
jgi:glycosyltransferase involved in cell wall biosynthesis